MRIAVVTLLIAIFIAAFLALVSSVLIRRNALTTGFYISSLERTDAFDRVYSDLLSDPEVSRSIDPFFGPLRIDRSSAVSALRFAAPPEQLRDWSELALDGITAYIRGDSQRYSGEINFAEFVENQRGSLVSYVADQLVAADVEATGSESEFSARLNEFLSNLSRGRVEGKLPSFRLTPAAASQITDLILRHLNPQAADTLRDQIEAHVSINDVVGALIVALPAMLEQELATANSDLLRWFGGETELDPARVIADVLQDQGTTVINRLDGYRDLAATVSPRWLPTVAVGIMFLSITALLILFRGVRARLLVAGLLLAGVGLFVWLASISFGEPLISLISGRPLEVALIDRPEGWGLPSSARDLIRDIRSELFGTLASEAALSGLLLMLSGLGVLLATEAARHVQAIATGRHRWPFTRQTAITAGPLAVALAVVPLLILTNPTGEPDLKCNGHAELCDRPYDEVTYAATHNSMATAADGWLLPAHDETLRQQLKDGVRALLIDTHYWRTPAEELEYLRTIRGFSPATIALVEQFFVELGDPPPGVHLCHGSCWLGAVALGDALRDVREFLEENPHEVITLIIEDDVSVADTVDEFERAGLLPMVLDHEPGERWPDLREMINIDRRLVVMAEVGSPPPAWYMHAWDFVQETPFDARSVNQLRCDENRGSNENSLFLMNHWINRTPPDRVDAANINSAEMILQRAGQCEEERGIKPNFIAVNFHRLGDVLGAVDRLNGFN